MLFLFDPLLLLAANAPFHCAASTGDNGNPIPEYTSRSIYFDNDQDNVPDLSRGVQYFCAGSNPPKGWRIGLFFIQDHEGHYLLGDPLLFPEQYIHNLVTDCDDNNMGRSVLRKVWIDEDEDGQALINAKQDIKCFAPGDGLVGLPGSVYPWDERYTINDPLLAKHYDCDDETIYDFSYDKYADNDGDNNGAGPSLGQGCGYLQGIARKPVSIRRSLLGILMKL